MKVVVIGSGRRVQQDLLPTLHSMNFKEILIYATRDRNILVRDTSHIVRDVRLLKDISDEDLVYIAVPPYHTYNVLALIRKINKGVRLLLILQSSL